MPSPHSRGRLSCSAELALTLKSAVVLVIFTAAVSGSVLSVLPGSASAEAVVVMPRVVPVGDFPACRDDWVLRPGEMCSHGAKAKVESHALFASGPVATTAAAPCRSAGGRCADADVLFSHAVRGLDTPLIITTWHREYYPAREPAATNVPWAHVEPCRTGVSLHPGCFCSHRHDQGADVGEAAPRRDLFADGSFTSASAWTVIGPGPPLARADEPLGMWRRGEMHHRRSLFHTTAHRTAIEKTYDAIAEHVVSGLDNRRETGGTYKGRAKYVTNPPERAGGSSAAAGGAPIIEDEHNVEIVTREQYEDKERGLRKKVEDDFFKANLIPSDADIRKNSAVEVGRFAGDHFDEWKSGVARAVRNRLQDRVRRQMVVDGDKMRERTEEEIEHEVDRLMSQFRVKIGKTAAIKGDGTPLELRSKKFFSEHNQVTALSMTRAFSFDHDHAGGEQKDFIGASGRRRTIGIPFTHEQEALEAELAAHEVTGRKRGSDGGKTEGGADVPGDFYFQVWHTNNDSDEGEFLGSVWEPPVRDADGAAAAATSSSSSSSSRDRKLARFDPDGSGATGGEEGGAQ